MPKLKLSILTVVFMIFAVFMGMQIKNTSSRGFFIGFVVTLLFGAFAFVFQITWYVSISKQFVNSGNADISDYQSPIDIWLVCIPFCMLMIVSYVFLGWFLVQVFFCTTLSLTGMLLGNGLGRGSGKWDIKKSIPFFFGVISSGLFAFLMEWMV